MPTVEKTSGGSVYIRPLDENFSIGDQTDVDNEMAAYLTEERGDFEEVDDADTTASAEVEPDDTPDTGDEPPDAALTHPKNLTIGELEDELATGKYDDMLDAVEDKERNSKERSGALDAIDARRDELED